MPKAPNKHIFMRRVDRDKWLAALRSGDYKQGRAKLMNSDGSYCCLGVLQMALDGCVEMVTGLNESQTYPTIHWLNEHNIVFRDERGSICRNPFFSRTDTHADTLNDHRRMTFLQIADEIEAECEVID
jgi:hypothetical protein